jgi:hypothetical protein
MISAFLFARLLGNFVPHQGQNLMGYPGLLFDPMCLFVLGHDIMKKDLIDFE